jgi:hypothetical protein
MHERGTDDPLLPTRRSSADKPPTLGRRRARDVGPNGTFGRSRRHPPSLRSVAWSMPRGPPPAPPIDAPSSDVEPLPAPRVTRIPRPACVLPCLTSITWIHSVCRWFGWSRWPVRAQGSPFLDERGNTDPDGSASIGGPCHPAVRGWREPTKIPRSASCRAQDTSFSETGLLECQSWTRLEPDPRPASTRAATPGRRARRRPDGRNPRRCAPPAPRASCTPHPVSSLEQDPVRRLQGLAQLKPPTLGETVVCVRLPRPRPSREMLLGTSESGKARSLQLVPTRRRRRAPSV